MTKRYGVSPDLLDDKAPALTLNEGSEIHWKESKNLTVTEVKKKQKARSGKNKGQVRTIVNTVPKASFFNFFSTPKEEDEEDEGGEDKDEEEEKITLSMEEDYDIGHTIRTAIIPEAVLWFTGEAIDEDDEDYEEEDGDEEEDDDEDEDDDDDDEEEPPKRGNQQKGKKPVPKGGLASKGGGSSEQGECKQN